MPSRRPSLATLPLSLPLSFGLGILTLALAAGALAGQSPTWNQWRGPLRDGTAPGFPAPESWTQGLSRLWSVDVGAGLSAPVADGERAYLLTREADDEVLTAFSLADGATLWQARDEAPFQANMQAANPQFFSRSKGKGPFATPLLAGGRIFTLGVGRHLLARDADTGETLWRRSLDVEFEGESGETKAAFNAPNYYGAACSPLLYAGTLVVQFGNSQRGQILGLDPETGETRWTWDGLAVVSSSPIVATLGGVEQLVAVTRYATVGLDPTDGSELWRFDVDSNAHVPTPIVFGDTVIFGTYQGDQIAIDVARDADGAWTATERWRSDRRTLVSTPVLRDGRLYGIAYNRRGQYYVLDASTGQALWGSEGREGPTASFVDVGAAILVLDAEGALLVTRPGEGDPAPELLARYPLTERQTWVHPAVVGGDLLIRDTDTFARWRFGGGGELTVANQPEATAAESGG